MVINELELFIQDNNLSDVEIAKINEGELINKSLRKNISDIEIYTDIRKIRGFLDEIFKDNMYTIGIELSDNNYEIKFRASKIQLSDIDGGIIFVDSTVNKRYLVKVSKLEIDKRTNKIGMNTDDVRIDNIPISNIYEYKDFYSTSLMDRILGNFEDENEKSIVEIMSRLERFVLRMIV